MPSPSLTCGAMPEAPSIAPPSMSTIYDVPIVLVYQTDRDATVAYEAAIRSWAICEAAH